MQEDRRIDEYVNAVDGSTEVIARVRDEADFQGWDIAGVLRVIGGRASEVVGTVPTGHAVRRTQTYGRAALVYEDPADSLPSLPNGWCGHDR